MCIRDRDNVDGSDENGKNDDDDENAKNAGSDDNEDQLLQPNRRKNSKERRRSSVATSKDSSPDVPYNTLNHNASGMTKEGDVYKRQVEELPTFHDYDMVKLEADAPLLFTFAIVGDGVFVDPTFEESIVSNNGLLITWYKDKVTSPIRSVGLNNDNIKGFSQHHLEQAFKLIRQYAPHIEKALDASD